MRINSVITIGRQYGSGGRYVGKLLAEKLEIPYYDKEILALAAKQSGICEEMFETHDEKPTKSFLYSLVTGVQMRGDPGSLYMDMPLNHKIFLAQFDTIKRIASQGPSVIVGRCADYVLRDHPNKVNVFIHSDMESRIHRAVTYYGLDPARAEEQIQKADRQRASYYNYYAAGKWGHVENYNLCIDTGAVGVEGAVEQIIDFVRRHEEWQQHGEK